MVCSASVTPSGARIAHRLPGAAPDDGGDDGCAEGEGEHQLLESCCWYCSHDFEGAPCVAPGAYDAAKDVYSVYGAFCSWGCVKRYLIERPNHEIALRFSLLNQLAKRMGYAQSTITPNPPVITLQRFGGPLTIEQFRAYGASGRRVDTVEPPLISWPIVANGFVSGGPEAAEPPAPTQLRGLRRPEQPVRVEEQHAASGGGGLYESYAERRRMESAKRKRDAACSPTSDGRRPKQVQAPSIEPPKTRSQTRRAPPPPQMRQTGTLVGFLKPRHT